MLFLFLLTLHHCLFCATLIFACLPLNRAALLAESKCTLGPDRNEFQTVSIQVSHLGYVADALSLLLSVSAEPGRLHHRWGPDALCESPGLQGSRRCH